MDAEFLDEIQTKILRVFLLSIHSHLYSLALRFLFLLTSTVQLLYTVRFTVHVWFKKFIQKPQV
jgi:hypothetical protein